MAKHLCRQTGGITKIVHATTAMSALSRVAADAQRTNEATLDIKRGWRKCTRKRRDTTNISAPAEKKESVVKNTNTRIDGRGDDCE